MPSFDISSEMDWQELDNAINQATKELQVKIVYYGPALCGKTTNLQQVHAKVQTAPENKGKLVSLADRKSTRLNSSHSDRSRMPSSA